MFSRIEKVVLEIETTSTESAGRFAREAEGCLFEGNMQLTHIECSGKLLVITFEREEVVVTDESAVRQPPDTLSIPADPLPKELVETDPPKPELSLQEQQLLQVLLRTLEELEVTIRTYNFLKKAGIYFVGDLVQKTEADLKPKKHEYPTGKIIVELKKLLAGIGLAFPGLDLGLGMKLSPALLAAYKAVIAQK